jgi:Uma2 family endonuclease
MPTIILEDEVVIPARIKSLADFRRWSLSDKFPQTGRIDFIAGCIELDLTPPRIYSHSLVISAIAFETANRVKEKGMGHVLGCGTRIVSAPADLSCEPDLTFVSWESLKTGRVKYLKAPKPLHEMDRIEVAGSPDLVVEIVSPTSVKKDTQRLPSAYFAAGVREFWLADARTDVVTFQIHNRGRRGFKPVPQTAQGFQFSEVLGCEFRLIRRRGRLADTFVFKLESHAH